MRWRLRERSQEEKTRDTLETADIQARLKWAMSELRQTLDRVEAELDKEISHGQSV